VDNSRYGREDIPALHVHSSKSPCQLGKSKMYYVGFVRITRPGNDKEHRATIIICEAGIMNGQHKRRVVCVMLGVKVLTKQHVAQRPLMVEGTTTSS